jgi:hypothetical protein
MDPSEFDLTTAAIRFDDNRRQAVRSVRYSPWRLGAYVTLALAAPIAAGTVAFFAAGGYVAVLAFILALPVTVAVVIWTWDAFLVERQRLQCEKLTMQQGPELPTPEVEAPPESVELRPGFPIDGEMISPVEVVRPEIAALRDDCLAFVRAGMRRSGWSRSKIAEGPDKLLTPTRWDRASKELQRLGYFKQGAAGLEPARDLNDVVKRLEAAR